MESNDDNFIKDNNINDLTKKISYLEREVENIQNTRREFFNYLAIMMIVFGVFVLIFPKSIFIVFFITALAFFFLSIDKH